ncbi:hypothetical protein ACIQF6_17350 [Kitasatospora sp. NPDC092948]|uniref:hypothetical protein n=1 Tax=Kitasatospora sp. NPDC092948 TaxID=3364088 RepID=UPI003822CAD3
MTNDWDTALAEAFAALLGEDATAAAAADPAARYGAYYASETLDEFLFPNSWATADALTDPEPTYLPDPDGPHPFSPWNWRFDLSASLFRFDPDLLAATGAWGADGHKGPRPFDDAFVTDLLAVATLDASDGAVVRGADLGPLLRRHGLDLAGQGATPLNHWLTVVLCVATEGALHAALRAATFTDRGPEHLVTRHDVSSDRPAAEPWEKRLDTVAHPGLRHHLRLLCRSAEDARSEGGCCTGSEHWPWSDVLDAAGGSLVLGWCFGEYQAGVAAARLPA